MAFSLLSLHDSNKLLMVRLEDCIAALLDLCRDDDRMVKRESQRFAISNVESPNVIPRLSCKPF